MIVTSFLCVYGGTHVCLWAEVNSGHSSAVLLVCLCVTQSVIALERTNEATLIGHRGPGPRLSPPEH